MLDIWQIKQTYTNKSYVCFFMYTSKYKIFVCAGNSVLGVFHVYIRTCIWNLCKIWSAIQISFNLISQGFKKQGSFGISKSKYLTDKGLRTLGHLDTWPFLKYWICLMSFPLCLDQLRIAEYKKLYKHVFSPLLLLGISEFLIFYGSLVLLQGKKNSALPKPGSGIRRGWEWICNPQKTENSHCLEGGEGGTLALMFQTWQ